jgi:uncharacterized membrane protein
MSFSDPTPGTPPPDPFASSRPPESSDQEAVWTFRGYRMKAGEFNTAMVHFFRAEISRANAWRTRLDATTNWAVVTTGLAISIAFNQSGHHGVVILNTLLVTIFLYIEARRYRYYELWSYRVRLMETDFFAAMLVPPFHPAPDWAESLAENLLHPNFSISMWEAFGRRLRRNYLWIYFILGAAWLLKTWIMSPGINSPGEFLQSASIGNLPGWIVISIGLGFNGLLFLVGLLTATLHQATGEILPRYAQDMPNLNIFEGEPHGTEGMRAWFRLSRKRQQFLALIITDRQQEVGALILKEMRRGVTSLPGTGMYTGKAHSVLMVALTVTEVNHLKTLVISVDPQAFIIVSPAQEILGRGFTPLKTDETS